MKKVYVLILTEMSHGEDPCALDMTEVFADHKTAKKALKECYESVLQDADGYEYELTKEFDQKLDEERMT